MTTRRAALLVIAMACTKAQAQERDSLPDGIYLISDDVNDADVGKSIVWVRFRDIEQVEPVVRNRLMAFDVETVEVDKAWGRPVVLVEFTSAASEEFARVTSEHQGRRFAIIVGGQIAVAPHVTEPIIGGQIHVTGGERPDEAAALAAHLRQASGS